MNFRTPSIDEYLAHTASEKIAPAGGSAGAVVGAVGTALCEMVCIHTAETDEYSNVATEVAELREQLRQQRGHLLDLAEADATVVEELFSTVGGEGQQTDRKRAIGVPLSIADACQNVLDLAIEVVAIGNRNALADAGTGVILVHAAHRASVFTVRSNLEWVSDQSFLDEVEQQVPDLESRAADARDQVMHRIDERS